MPNFLQFQTAFKMKSFLLEKAICRYTFRWCSIRFCRSMSTLQRLYTVIITSYCSVCCEKNDIKRMFPQNSLVLMVPANIKKSLRTSMKGLLLFCFFICRESCLINSIRQTSSHGTVQEGTDQNETRCLSVILFETLSLPKLAKQSWCCLLKEQWDKSDAATWYSCWDFFSVNST